MSQTGTNDRSRSKFGSRAGSKLQAAGPREHAREATPGNILLRDFHRNGRRHKSFSKDFMHIPIE